MRSHSGVTEHVVPMVINRRLRDVPDQVRNFDAYAIGLNHVVAA